MSKKNEQQIRIAISILLIAHRNDNNLTQEQMAALLGIPRTTYAAYEERRAKPPIDVLIKIGRIVGKTVEDIICVC